MSLSDIGNKSQGQLWKAADWNELVAFVQDLDARIFGADGLAGQVDTVSEAQDSLREQVSALGTRVETLFGQFRRLTLETSRSRFALGELAEVTARLTDLDGQPLSGTGPGGFSVDFVSTWGFLKPARGFTATAGTDGRSISVPVDDRGIARVRLQPEHAESLSEETETEVAEALTTLLPTALPTALPSGGGRSIGESLLRAETPNQARLEGTFSAITAEYDAPQAGLFRAYHDAYYLHRAARPGSLVFPRPPIVAPPTVSWRQERATVLAFVKDDADPLTADPGRAFSSITVTFVDWIRHWIVNDYLATFEESVPQLREQLIGAIREDPAATSEEFKRRIGEVVRETSVLGRQRDFLAADLALETLPVLDTPAFVGDLRDSLRDAVSIQRALDNVQFATKTGAREQVAFDVFSRTSERTTKEAGGLAGQMRDLELRLEATVGTVREDLAGQERTAEDLSRSVGALSQTMDAIASGRLRQVEDKLDEEIRGREQRATEIRDLGKTVDFLRGRLDLRIDRPRPGGGGGPRGGGAIGGLAPNP